jgi:NAD(P)-dependent dehydrogenase (short-subunit alcohol dehydrogenase family)
MNDVVVVTGAAGALGHAVLAELRRRDRTVVALDRPSGRLDQLGGEDGIHAVAVELADRAAVRAAWQEIDKLGTPAALVALAGGFVPGKLADLDEDALEGLWRSNVVSMLWSAQEAAPRMAAAGGGAIVTMGSKTAVAGPAPLAHATSKAAVVRASELLADELRAALGHRHARQPDLDVGRPGRPGGRPGRDRPGNRVPDRPGRRAGQRGPRPRLRRLLSPPRPIRG